MTFKGTSCAFDLSPLRPVANLLTSPYDLWHYQNVFYGFCFICLCCHLKATLHQYVDVFMYIKYGFMISYHIFFFFFLSSLSIQTYAVSVLISLHQLYINDFSIHDLWYHNNIFRCSCFLSVFLTQNYACVSVLISLHQLCIHIYMFNHSNTALSLSVTCWYVQLAVIIT